MFRLCKAISDCLDWVGREALLLHDELVKIVPEEISAGGSSVAVIDCEEGTSRPLVDLLEVGLCDVEDNADTVLIVISKNQI